jgi:hypothetical protein
VVPGNGAEVWGKIHMNRGRGEERRGEERRGKEMDGCPLTIRELCREKRIDVLWSLVLGVIVRATLLT